MKQLLQSLKTGIGEVAQIPEPASTPGHLLIRTTNTLVSAGTERMLVEFGKSSIFRKVQQQPDKIKQVFEKVRTDGFMSALDAVRSKLDQPLVLGYCNAGVVLNNSIEGFTVGDRVVSNGAHAEVVRVPKNLAAKIPESVDDESASFTPLAAIGLQSIRLAQPSIGEAFVVQGLGLIGLMTVQMLRANGCRVLGIDFDSSRCELARQFGANTVDLSKNEDPLVMAEKFSRGRGVDAVIICAASKSNEVVHQAAEMCRKRGRIVLVGVVGLNLRRDDFYKKEISFQVSASYGPGRYDPAYEELGQDYPIGFVRWTQQRNFEAVLDMMAVGTLNVKPLITHRFKIDDATSAYNILSDNSALGIVIKYPNSNNPSEDSFNPQLMQRVIELRKNFESKKVSIEGDAIKNIIPVIGFIGAGNYASRVLIPAFKREGAVLDILASSTGVSCVHHGRKTDFAKATTNLDAIWSDSQINTVVIATRHNAHASQVISALDAGKNVFVEKPLCLTLGELEDIRIAFFRGQLNKNTIKQSQHDLGRQTSNQLLDPNYASNGKPILMVGFNRRFSPHIQKIKQLLDTIDTPKSFIMTINAGAIASDHWTQDSQLGGGRIIGEACHFIDLLRFLAAAPIIDFDRIFMEYSRTRDTTTIILKFSNGSIGTIHYFSNGSKIFPKERLEIFTSGRILVLDNFRRLTGYGWPGFSKMNLWKQDKGQVACVRAFLNFISQPQNASQEKLIPLDEIFEVAEVTIKLAT